MELHGRFPISLALAVAVNLLLMGFVHWMVIHEPQWTEPVSIGQTMNIVPLPSTEPAAVANATNPDHHIAQPAADRSSPPPPVPPLVLPRPVPIQAPAMFTPTVRDIRIPLRLSARPVLDGTLNEVASEPLSSQAAAPGEHQTYRRSTPVHRESPRYPRRAKRSGVEGRVTVAFTVTTTGDVRDPKVIKSTPPGIFDRVVLNAIRNWRFTSRASEVRAVQDITFTLKDR